MNLPDLPNARVIADGVISAGQPSPGQLRTAAAAGIKTIVNLCAPGECDWDEAAIVQGLGMNYVAIPVPGASAVTVANAKKLHLVLEDATTRPVIVHCASGNRVGALFALRAFREEGLDREAALEKGRLAGLTRLEPYVRECLARAG